MRALAGSLLADANTADDVVQEACLAALEHPPKRGPLGRAWFVGVVRNLARRTHRDAARRERRESAAARPERVPPAAQAAEEIEAHRRLVDAVYGLADPYRTAVVLRYFDGLTPREIAVRHGVPRETASTWIHRGLAMLRSHFEEDRDDWRAALLPLFSTRRPVPIPPLVPVVGAIAMSVKKILVVVAAVLLLAAGGLAVRSIRSGSANSTAAPTEVAAQRSRAPRTKSPPAEEPAALPPDVPLPAPVDLDKCDRDLDLHGVVVTAQGKPLAGASVATVTWPWRDHHTYNYDAFDDEVRGPATRTASDGTFALRLSRGDAVTLRVAAAGFARRELPLRQAGERVRVVLDAGVRLVVTIRDAAGQPLPDVPFRVTRDYESDDTFRREGTTGADGRGFIEGLPGGVFGYVVQGMKSRVVLPTTRVTLPTVGQVDLEVVARGECRTVTGRVLDNDTGQAIAGARVGLGENLRVETTSGADGAFTLGEWSGDANDEVHAIAEGYARAVALSGEGNRCDLRLKHGASMLGRIVGADGAPVAGAMVSALAFHMGTHPWRLSAGHATSAADGRFRVDGLDGSTDHTVFVSTPGNARLARTVHLAGAETDLGDVALVAPHAIDGRVVAGESPVARAKVTAMLRDAPAESRGRGAENAERYTDDLGRFRFHDLAAGRYYILVQRDGAPGATTDVEVPADRDVIDVTLRTEPTRDVVVRVVDDRGAPVAGIWVMVSASGRGNPISQRTDASGTAAFAVPIDDVNVRVIPGSAEGRAYLEPPPRALSVNDSEARFVVGVGVPTRCRLVDTEGHPVAQASVTIEQEGRETVSVRSDANGEVGATLSSAGLAVIQFYGGVLSNMGGQRQIDVDGGLRGRLADVVPGTEGLVIRCDRVTADRTLRVRVVGPDGTPVPKAPFFYCRADVPDSMDIRYGTTGDDGTVTLTGLMPGRFSMQTLMRDDWFASRSVTASPDGQEVTLAYRATVVLAGVAAWPDGRIPAKAEARLYRGKDLLLSNDLDKIGAFRLLAPVDERGPFRIVVHGTEADGEFRGILDGVAAGSTGLRVRIERK